MKPLTSVTKPTKTIVYVLQDLCLHPEYLVPIRRELETSYAEFERTGQGLPLLDSFMKESHRLTPVESSTCCFYSPGYGTLGRSL